MPTPQSLEALAGPPEHAVAVVAPHPDDFDAIGVTLMRLHRRGHAIHLAVLTSAVSGVDEGFGGAHTRAEKRDLREAEQRASCALFGLAPERLTFLRLAEDERGHPVLDDANHERLADWLRAVAPRLIFLPHGNDTNVAHQRTGAMVTRVRAVLLPAPLLCLARDPKTIAMRVDLAVAFGAADAEWKGALLRCHGSQQERNLRTRGAGFDERILAMNAAAGAELRAVGGFAEVFEMG